MPVKFAVKFDPTLAMPPELLSINWKVVGDAVNTVTVSSPVDDRLPASVVVYEIVEVPVKVADGGVKVIDVPETAKVPPPEAVPTSATVNVSAASTLVP